MKYYITKFLLLLLLLILPSLSIKAKPVQKYASLGDFKLESGKVIKDCIIGYHTCGRVNRTRSNVIVMLTYFGGNSEDLLYSTGQGDMADSTKYYVLAVDAFGDGVSSSPSNSKLQVNGSFPVFNMRDIVNAEHMLVSKILDFKHVYCVMGTSMGGMQTFQWIVSYPDFMDKAVIQVGSPRLTSNDLLLWNSELLAIKEGLGCGAAEESINNTVAVIHTQNLRTPDYFVKHVSPAEFPKYLKTAEDEFTKIFNPYNWMSQLHAMILQNIFKPFNNDMVKAADVVKSKVFVIASRQDHMVNPHPAINFAKLINAKVLELNNDCGHFGAECEIKKVNREINNFLNDK